MNNIFTLLKDKNFITPEQYKAIEAYQELGLFSLRNELLFLLYISILLFTSGVGVLIYKNIDTLGHTVLLVLLGLATLVSFYFCIKKAKGFTKQEVLFENPLYDYWVLFTAILSCTFIGYFQYNLNLTATNYNITSLLSALVCIAMAYYFDNKSVLVLGITALASFVGLSLQVQTFFANELFHTSTLIFSGLLFGVFLLLWQRVIEVKDIKFHFSFVLLTFAFHTLALSCLSGIGNDDKIWFLYLLVLIAVVYFFYKKSLALDAISWYVFVLFYGYIGLNIFIFKLLAILDASQFYEFIIFLSPFYVIGSIVLFIKMIKDFKKNVYVN